VIYDRTASDVASAKKMRLEKVQKFIDLTDEEVETLERGLLTINTLNRIENKQAEIKAMLDNMGYFNTPVINKTWTVNDIFTADDLQRIVDNNTALRAAFYAMNDSPKNAIAKYYYEEFNSLEKILFDISSNIEYTVSKYRRCGTFNCGG
jgi:galactose-1-phosphate uridylyltransferase